ncbi:MAG: hypothetical protein ACJAZZ_000595 [Dokdonia donghaensis]|jgi:hypothetical protein
MFWFMGKDNKIHRVEFRYIYDHYLHKTYEI